MSLNMRIYVLCPHLRKVAPLAQLHIKNAAAVTSRGYRWRAICKWHFAEAGICNMPLKLERVPCSCNKVTQRAEGAGTCLVLNIHAITWSSGRSGFAEVRRCHFGRTGAVGCDSSQMAVRNRYNVCRAAIALGRERSLGPPNSVT